MSDKELIALYLEGSEKAFEHFYSRYKDTIFRYVLGMCGEYEVAKDICSCAWEVFCNKCHLVTNNPSAYLFIIARNQLNNVYRKTHTSPSSLPEVEIIEECLMEERAELSHVLKQVSKLPWEQREALLLKHFAGFSIGELATYQGINQESAKSRVRYAVKKLRNYFSLSGEVS